MSNHVFDFFLAAPAELIFKNVGHPSVCSTLGGKAIWSETTAISLAIKAMLGHFGRNFNASVKARTLSQREMGATG